MDDILSGIFVEMAEAQEALVNGDAQMYIRLLDPSNEILFFDGMGGRAWSGYDEVVRGLESQAWYFDGGASRVEFLWGHVSESLAIVAFIEHNKILIQNRNPPGIWALRVSQSYRHGAHGWRIIHRHADPMLRLSPMYEHVSSASKG